MLLYYLLFHFVFGLQADIDAAVQLLKLKVDYKQATGQDYKTGCPPSECVVSQDNGPAADGEDMVDPWNVSTTNAKGVDYDKLIGQRGKHNVRSLGRIRIYAQRTLHLIIV
jgi:hypothetical protein